MPQANAARINFTLQNLQPGTAARSKGAAHLATRLQRGNEEMRILPDGKRIIFGGAWASQAQKAQALSFKPEAPLAVAGPAAPFLGLDPDLEQVHGLRGARVELAVPHTNACRHCLHLTRAHDRAVAEAISVLDGPGQHHSEYLHVTMTMHAEPGSGSDMVFVDDTEASEALVNRVSVFAKREGVPANKPSGPCCPPIF